MPFPLVCVCAQECVETRLFVSRVSLLLISVFGITNQSVLAVKQTSLSKILAREIHESEVQQIERGESSAKKIHISPENPPET